MPPVLEALDCQGSPAFPSFRPRLHPHPFPEGTDLLVGVITTSQGPLGGLAPWVGLLQEGGGVTRHHSWEPVRAVAFPLESRCPHWQQLKQNRTEEG